eukprot:sb/3478074/
MNETTSNTFGIAFYTFLKLFVTKFQHLHGFPKTNFLFCSLDTGIFFPLITPTFSRPPGRSRGGVISLPSSTRCSYYDCPSEDVTGCYINNKEKDQECHNDVHI